MDYQAAERISEGARQATIREKERTDNSAAQAQQEYEQRVEELENQFRSALKGDLSAPATFAPRNSWTIADVFSEALDFTDAPKDITPPSFNEAFAVILEAASNGQRSACDLVNRAVKCWASKYGTQGA